MKFYNPFKVAMNNNSLLLFICCFITAAFLLFVFLALAPKLTLGVFIAACALRAVYAIMKGK